MKKNEDILEKRLGKDLCFGFSMKCVDNKSTLYFSNEKVLTFIYDPSIDSSMFGDQLDEVLYSSLKDEAKKFIELRAL